MPVSRTDTLLQHTQQVLEDPPCSETFSEVLSGASAALRSKRGLGGLGQPLRGAGAIPGCEGSGSALRARAPWEATLSKQLNGEATPWTANSAEGRSLAEGSLLLGSAPHCSLRLPRLAAGPGLGGRRQGGHRLRPGARWFPGRLCARCLKILVQALFALPRSARCSSRT